MPGAAPTLQVTGGTSSLSAAPALSDPRDRVQFDTTSGWFYDPITSYYYDHAKDQFYNGSKQQYLCWNPAKTCFEPAPVDATPSVDPTLPAADVSTTTPAAMGTAVTAEGAPTPAAPGTVASELEQWQREQEKLGKKKKPAKMKGFAIKKVWAAAMLRTTYPDTWLACV